MTTALNVTEVTFDGARQTSTGSLYQFDYGQILVFTDLTLPETFEVDFAFNGCATSGRSLGENNQIQIPDIYLQYNGTLKGYIFLHEGDEDGETVYVFSVPIIKRPEPTDSVPTPVEHTIITELIERMDAAVEEAEQSAEEAKEAAESVPTDAVQYGAEQTLTDSEKSTARANINASDVAYEIHNLKDGSANHSIRQTSSAQESSSYTIGEYASSFGRSTKSSGQASHSEGTLTVASGASSHAEGAESTASGQASHAEGSATASGNSSHAENNQTTASGNSSHSEGMYTIASGGVSHSEGLSTTASGVGSHTHGEGTVANHRAQTAIGQYNIADPSTEVVGRRGNYVEIVGNGTADNARSNARTLDWNGNETLSGKLTVGANAENANDVPTLAQVQGMIPTVPTNVSAFTNDAGYQTASDVEASIVSTSLYGVCNSGKTADPKIVSIPEVTELYEGLSIKVKFANINTKSSPSLKVNDFEAKAIMLRDNSPAVSSETGSWYAGAVINFTYDGTNWVMNDFNNTTYSAMSWSEMETGAATTARTITAQRLKQAVLYHGKDIDVATTSANGLMSATDKSRLDDLYADYSSAMTALGV